MKADLVMVLVAKVVPENHRENGGTLGMVAP